MGCCYVVISMLLCFLFACWYLILAESTDAGGNLQMNDKKATLLVPTGSAKNQDRERQNITLSTPKPVWLPRRANILDGGSNTISHYAMWRTTTGKYYGFRAEMSIWGSPNQQYSQDSGSAIQMYCAEGDRYRLIEAGFHVAPALYHNRDVRFFTYWTDTKSADCYNLDCPGFVPARGAALVPGQAIAPTSTYDVQDHYVRLSINEDPNSGDLVLYRHDLERPSFLGHFPRELCPGTSRIQALTGFVNYLMTIKGPPMGSGHFPSRNAKRSGYFKHIKIYDSKGHAWDPHTTPIKKLADKWNCYNQTDLYLQRNMGYTFYYGGPSGCVG